MLPPLKIKNTPIPSDKGAVHGSTLYFTQKSLTQTYGDTFPITAPKWSSPSLYPKVLSYSFSL